MKTAVSEYSGRYWDALHNALHQAEYTQGEALEPISDGLGALCAESGRVKASGAVQYFVGNGASSAFASHMASDWTKSAGIRSVAVSDAALLTACANDFGVDDLFAAPIRLLARPGDLLVTVSSSGNSANILEAIAAARGMGLRVVTFSALKPVNRSRPAGDVNVYVPCKTYGIAESAHQAVLHAWLDHFLGVTEWDRTVEQNMNRSEFIA